ncbi:MAG: tRNA pseudouridine(38-40) synthase TruA [Spirosomaceae bacterium]|nr:tRNA pseudouridine(38-40) synthase TruA [Spirosomataceae bacterium]
MRYLIELAYKGTEFHGWQSQPNASSVQQNIEDALSTLFKSKIQIVGSSRTDTGVHCLQQFAHFEIDFELDVKKLEKLVFQLNAILPKSIAIKRIFKVNQDFHARFDAKFRVYQYRIMQNKNPFWYETSYHYKTHLDLELMNQAGLILQEYTDFQCFSKVHTDVYTFNCKIEYAFWERQDDFLLFNIKADRFLRGMVRAIVGTLIEVGLKKISLNEFEEIICSKNRNNAGRAVPPEGLTLMKVGYDFNANE